MPQTIVISDVHLGSPYCQIDRFIRFLRLLPAGATLVLNGDTVDRIHSDLPAEHAAALDLLRSESERRRVVWVRGNHDDGYEMPDPRQIQFTTSYAMGTRLFLSHGYEFDNLRPRGRWLITFFDWLHQMRLKLGGEAIHVAFYAKKFPWLYAILRRHVAANAVVYANERGFVAVATGHTHFAEDRVQEGVHLLNTGAWTETPTHALYVNDTEMELRVVGGEESG